MVKPRLVFLHHSLDIHKQWLWKALSEDFDLTVIAGASKGVRPWDLQRDSEFESVPYRIVISRGPNLFVQSGRERGVDGVQLRFDTLRLLNNEDPDLVVSTETGMRSLLAYWYSQRKKIPFTIWWEGTPFQHRRVNWLRRMIRKFLATRVDHWITHGSEFDSTYVQSLGVARERIFETPFTINGEPFSPGTRIEKLDDNFTLLVASQLHKRKGIAQLFASLEHVAQIDEELFSRLELRIAGSGQLENSIAEFAATRPYIVLLGALSREQLISEYRNANVFVFPSLDDQWGVVVNEAVMCGTPCFCSHYAGAHRLLPSQWWFDPLRPSDLAERLRAFSLGQYECVPLTVKGLPKPHSEVGKEVSAFLQSLYEQREKRQ